MTVIWWLRRDQRLHDNRSALDAALSQGGTVIPVFVIDPVMWSGKW